MKTILYILLFVMLSLQAWSQAANKYIRQGNVYYNDAQYLQSAKSYSDALIDNPNSFEASFNLGDALYRQQKFEEAAKQFEGLTSMTNDANKLSAIYHNIGNSYLQQHQADKAIEAYKNALRYNPQDTQTRYNLMYAQELKKQQENQNQDNQDQQQNQDNQDQQQNQDKQDQQQNQDKQDQQQNQDKQDQQQNQDKQDPLQISQEDAIRILQALEQNESEIQKRLQQKQGQKIQVEKDW